MSTKPIKPKFIYIFKIGNQVSHPNARISNLAKAKEVGKALSTKHNYNHLRVTIIRMNGYNQTELGYFKNGKYTTKK